VTVLLVQAVLTLLGMLMVTAMVLTT
jgi:hypothetical protein